MEAERDAMRSDLKAAIEGLGRLYVAVVADVLDRLGRRDQVMWEGIRPVTEPVVVVGLAHPIKAMRSDAQADDPYAKELEAVDAVPPGAIVVFDTERACDASVWGELLATRAIRRGAVGAIVDGGVRDVKRLREKRFPTHAASVSANDSYGRLEVLSYGEPIRCGDVPVGPRDVVMADGDGVVVIPEQLVCEVAAAAAVKVEHENHAREMLVDGCSIAEAYRRYGVL
jgi:4-hydroxy-4-methyl-2-oxoglutarate aldolase